MQGPSGSDVDEHLESLTSISTAEVNIANGQASTPGQIWVQMDGACTSL